MVGLDFDLRVGRIGFWVSGLVGLAFSLGVGRIGFWCGDWTDVAGFCMNHDIWVDFRAFTTGKDTSLRGGEVNPAVVWDKVDNCL